MESYGAIRVVTLGRRGTSRERLAELYGRHSRAGMWLSFVLTQDRAQAEDLFHESFVRACGHIGSLRDEGAFGAYLRKTIITQHSSHRRRRALERERLQRASDSTRTETHEPDVALQQDMWRMLSALPARQRAVLYLRFYEDRSEAETAEILGCSPKAVRSLVHRGISTLRTDYRGDEE